jgi:phosphotriesterase-related protein
MVKRGHVDHLALSHDYACWSDFLPTVEAYNTAMPDNHYVHIHDQVIPALLETGVTRDQIDRMFIDNPRRHFEAAARRYYRAKLKRAWQALGQDSDCGPHL